MRVTIAICCYNAAATIERAVAAAQKQTHPDIEILVADDASTDRSVQIAYALAKQDPRIRVLQHLENKGNAGTRNTLVTNATGEVVVFQDDDDESLPDRVEKQLRALLEFESATGGMVACHCARINAKTGKIKRSMGTDHPVSGDAVALHLLAGDPLEHAGEIGTCTLMARRSTLIDIPFDHKFRRAVDREWAVRFVQNGGHIASTGEALLRKHTTQRDYKSDIRQFNARHQIVLKNETYLVSKGAFRAAKVVHRSERLRFPGSTKIFDAAIKLIRPGSQIHH